MNDRLPKREEVPAEMTWRLEDIYPDEVLWEKELEEAKELAAEVGKYEGRLGESARNLYEALKIYDDCSLKLDRVGGYSFMRHDQDAGNSRYQELQLKAQSASVRISEKLSFMEPEILAIPDEVIARFCEEEPGIRDYEVTIREIRRMKEHTLTKEMEQLLPAMRSSFPTAASCRCRCPRTESCAGSPSRSSTRATVNLRIHGRLFTTARSSSRYSMRVPGNILLLLLRQSMETMWIRQYATG